MLLGLNVRNLFTHEVKTFLCFKRLRTLRWRYTEKVSNIQQQLQEEEPVDGWRYTEKVSNIQRNGKSLVIG